MADELIDIVDEKDVVTGTVLKSVAHLEGILHRVVIVEVINSKGEWLMVRQAPDRQDPGKFVNPVGGHVQSGEPVTSAVRREVKEELGIDVSEFEFIGKKIYSRQVREKKENHLFVLYQVHSDEEPTLNEESVDYRWFSREQLKKELQDNPTVFGASFIFVVNSFFPELLS